jgi:hypothetical protein
MKISNNCIRKENQMKRKWLAIGIILLFVGVTIAPTINFNTVKASQQNVIKERINQRELLFQTIVDIANNKEIQRIILKSQMSRGIFPTSEIPVLTKTHIRQMYFIGLILSKVISKSRIQSLVGKYQFNNQEIQQELSSVIEKDTIINSKITLLKNSECNCENEKEINWSFPVLCTILFFIFLPLLLLGYLIMASGLTIAYCIYLYGAGVWLAYLADFLIFLGESMLLVPMYIGQNFNCWWDYSD